MYSRKISFNQRVYDPPLNNKNIIYSPSFFFFFFMLANQNSKASLFACQMHPGFDWHPPLPSPGPMSSLAFLMACDSSPHPRQLFCCPGTINLSCILNTSLEISLSVYMYIWGACNLNSKGARPLKWPHAPHRHPQSIGRKRYGGYLQILPFFIIMGRDSLFLTFFLSFICIVMF